LRDRSDDESVLGLNDNNRPIITIEEVPLVESRFLRSDDVVVSRSSYRVTVTTRAIATDNYDLPASEERFYFSVHSIDGNGGGEVSIREDKKDKSDSRYGIRFPSGNIVSEAAEIAVALPDNAEVSEMNVVVYDALGNVVFATNERSGETAWALTNNADRFVANGAYLVVAEVKDRNGRTYVFAAKLGVKR
jgi:hypothetical protein